MGRSDPQKKRKADRKKKESKQETKKWNKKTNKKKKKLLDKAKSLYLIWIWYRTVKFSKVPSSQSQFRETCLTADVGLLRCCAVFCHVRPTCINGDYGAVWNTGRRGTACCGEPHAVRSTCCVTCHRSHIHSFLSSCRLERVLRHLQENQNQLKLNAKFRLLSVIIY
jgi:hypothetical protein